MSFCGLQKFEVMSPLKTTEAQPDLNHVTQNACELFIVEDAFIFNCIL